MSLIRIPRAEAVIALSFVSLLFALPLQAQTDDPALINITTLEQLHVLRYDLDGNGTPSGNAAKVTAYEAAFGLSVGGSVSCAGGCTGYELMNDLDFASTKWGEDCASDCLEDDPAARLAPRPQ